MKLHIGKNMMGEWCAYRWVAGQVVVLPERFSSELACRTFYMEAL